MDKEYELVGLEKLMADLSKVDPVQLYENICKDKKTDYENFTVGKFHIENSGIQNKCTPYPSLQEEERATYNEILRKEQTSLSNGLRDNAQSQNYENFTMGKFLTEKERREFIKDNFESNPGLDALKFKRSNKADMTTTDWRHYASLLRPAMRLKPRPNIFKRMISCISNFLREFGSYVSEQTSDFRSNLNKWL